MRLEIEEKKEIILNVQPTTTSALQSALLKQKAKEIFLGSQIHHRRRVAVLKNTWRDNACMAYEGLA